MPKSHFTLVAAVAVSVLGFPSVLSQDLPREQPNLLTIIREQVKVGRADDHAKHEAGWPAAFAKAKSPNYYLAMSSLTGRPQVWYVVPWKSHADEAESMKREDNDPVLSAELARLSRADAEYIDDLCIIQTVARKDLSLGDFPDLAKARFFHNTIFRVRPGKQELFENAAKAYGAAIKRANPKAAYRVYQVIAGMPGPAFIVFSSVDDYANFDQRMAAEVAMSPTEEEQSALQQFTEEGLLEAEANRFRIDPQQSYVAQETKDRDPDFWNVR